MDHEDEAGNPTQGFQPCSVALEGLSKRKAKAITALRLSDISQVFEPVDILVYWQGICNLKVLATRSILQ